MRFVVDTSVLIDHLRGDPAATGLLVTAARREDELWSVTIVRTEILAGVRPPERSATLELLRVLRWQDVDATLADRAGELANAWMPAYPGVDTVDYLIAAATELLGAELWTRNVKHFPMFPDLRSPYG